MRFRTALAAAAMLAAAVQPALAGSRILSMLSAENNEAQAMSFVIANQLQATGHQVEMLLCGPAGDIVTTTPPASATVPITPQGASVRALAERLLAQGGKIDVCAIYLPNRKQKPDVLIAGVGVAQPKDIAATIADPAVKVIGR